jgi:erythromycin esterase
MKKYLLLYLVTLIYFESYSQGQLKKYVQNNTVPISSIQADFADDSDLEEIAKAVGDARVIMLGEQDHGDGATMLAKSRLIKFLHEKKGFNVLAFESDFFALNQGWEELPKNQQSIQQFLRYNIHGVWSRCQQCDELLNSYIPNSYIQGKPLIISGFDNQSFYRYSTDSLMNITNSYLRKQNIEFCKSLNYKDKFLPLIKELAGGNSYSNLAKKKDDLNSFIAMADTVISQLAGSKDFEFMLVKNLQSYARQISTEVYAERSFIRDEQMAQNLDWLSKVKYPNDKIIVWAANTHILKNANTAFKYPKLAGNYMGTVFTKDSLNNEQTYVLGFTSKGGFSQRAGFREGFEVYKPIKNGFENWIDNKHYFAFIDFKHFKKQNPGFKEFIPMKGYGHGTDLAVWTDIFDGVFYIRNMTPCDNKK